jgi:hypothetical protein
MNPPKCSDEDYINFVIATPRIVTATEAARVQPEAAKSPQHDAFTRLLERLEPDPDTLSGRKPQRRLTEAAAFLSLTIRRLINLSRGVMIWSIGIGRANTKKWSAAST